MDYVRADEIEDWLDELEILRTHFRCRGPKFVKPFHLATLAHALRRNPVSQLNLPEKIAPYAHTMDVWGALDISSPFGPQEKNPGGRFHPVTLLRDRASIDPSAAALVELFKPVCRNERTLDAVQTMLRELIDNCFSHSAVTDGLFGIICAQVWSSARKAQIVLADSGIGIRSSLMGNPQLLGRLKYENSCEMATAYGITGKPEKKDGGHSGYGLAVARGLIEQGKGVLYVRSGNEAFYLSRVASHKTTTKSRWNGTLLVIEWDLDVPMDIGAVYAGFPLPEGMTDDDFDL